MWGRCCPIRASSDTTSHLLSPHKRKSYFVFPGNQPGLEGEGKSRSAKGLHQPLTRRGVLTAPDSTRAGPPDSASTPPPPPPSPRGGRSGRRRASPRARPEAHLKVLPDGAGWSPCVPRHSSLACAPLATYLSQPPRFSCCPGWGARPGAPASSGARPRSIRALSPSGTLGQIWGDRGPLAWATVSNWLRVYAQISRHLCGLGRQESRPAPYLSSHPDLP